MTDLRAASAVKRLLGGSPMAWDTPTVVGLLLIVPGLVLLGAAGLSAVGHLPRNPIVGFRTPVAFSSRAVWNAAHRAAAPSMACAGAVAVGAGMGLALLQARPAVAGVMLLVCAFLMVGAFMWGLARAADASRQAEYLELRLERAGETTTLAGPPVDRGDRPT